MTWRTLDLFTGIGGFSLAAQWVWGDELEIVAFCEINKFCQKVLKKYWPEVPIIEDIKNVKWIIAKSEGKNDRRHNGESQRGQVQELGISYEQRITIPPIDLLTGGFPCQPFSCAGRRAGTGDDRYLWPETIRTIKEIRSSWIVLENVAGLLSILEPSSLSEVEVKEIELFQQDESIEVGEIVERIHRRIISRVIDDLKQAGYLLPTLADGTPIILCLPACGVGAPHRRDRIWIIGYASGSGRQQVSQGPHEDEGQHERRPQIQSDQPSGSDCHAPDTINKGCIRRSSRSDSNLNGIQESEQARDKPRSAITRCNENAPDTKTTERELSGRTRTGRQGFTNHNSWSENWLEVATRLCRVDDGVSRRVDRLRALGNSVVPQVAAEIFRAIKEVEEHKED